MTYVTFVPTAKAPPARHSYPIPMCSLTRRSVVSAVGRTRSAPSRRMDSR